MQTIFVSPEFPLNRRMRRAVRRGKLQVVREGGERASLGGGDEESREWINAFCGELSRLADPDKIDAVKRIVEKSIGGDARIALARELAESAGGVAGGNGEGEEGEESGTGFEIVRKNAREMFEGRGQFRVPIFQRDYVWGGEQWEDFWADVSGSKPQYEGGIVLRDIGRNRFEVIDGQQRLTTFCLLVIAALRMLHDSKEDGGFGILRSDPVCKKLADAFLVHGGDLDGNIERRNMKVVPHDPQWNGDGIFLSKLMSIRARQPGGEFDPFPGTGNTPEKQMKNSVKDFFMKKLRGLNLRTPDEVCDFVLNRAGGNLVFSRVIAAHNEGAHAIFETLNGRGRALTTAELIKAYFMSLLGDGAAEKCDREWDGKNGIRRQLDGAGVRGAGSKERGNKEMADFIWAVHVCRFGAVPKQRLFRSIAKKIRDKDDVDEFFGIMRAQIPTYVQILAPKSEFWGRGEFGKVDGLRHFRASRARAPFIMAVRHRKEEDLDAYSVSLGICAAIGVRIGICGPPRGIDHNLPGTVFNRLAREIWHAGQFSADDILKDPDLADLYHKEAGFADAFGEFTLSAPRGRLSENQFGIFACLLRTLEAHLGGDVERLNDRKPKDYVVRCHSGDEARHRLSEYCLQARQGEPEFLTNELTASMGRDQRGKQLGEWAAEVPDWRIDRLEGE